MKKYSSTFIVSTLFISGFSGSVAPLNVLAEQTTSVSYNEPIYYDEVNVNLTQTQSNSYTITLNTTYSISESKSTKLAAGTYTVTRNGSVVSLNNSNGNVVYKGSSFNIFPTVYSLDSYITFSNTKYSYLGDLKFTPGSDAKTIAITNSLPTQHYLYGVVPYEMSESWASNGGMEALKAQASAARTYTMNRINRTLSDTTSDQVYKGYSKSNKLSIQAVNETQGVYITANGKAIENAFYSSTNGGYTMSVQNVYNGSNYSYLQFKKDTYDANNVASHKNWGFTLHQEQVSNYSKIVNGMGSYDVSVVKEKDLGLTQFDGLKETVLKNEGIASTQDIKILRIPTLAFTTVGDSTTSATNLKGTVTVEYAVYNKTNPKSYTVKTYSITQRSYNFYTSYFFGKSDGLGMIRSANINTSTLVNGLYTIKGNGWGHGMGMSQWGAYARSKAGQSYSDILKFYYDNTTLTNHTTTSVFSNLEQKTFAYKGDAFSASTLTSSFEVGSAMQVLFYLDDTLIGSKNAVKGSHSISMDLSKFTEGKHTLRIVPIDDDLKDITKEVNVPSPTPVVTHYQNIIKENKLIVDYSIDRPGYVYFYIDGQLTGTKNSVKGRHSITIDTTNLDSSTHKLKIKVVGADRDWNSYFSKELPAAKVTYHNTTFKNNNMTVGYSVDSPTYVCIYLDNVLIGTKSTLPGLNSITMDKSKFEPGNHKLKIVNSDNNTIVHESTVTLPGNVNTLVAATTTAKKITYTVQKGDTLYSISVKNKLTVDKIKSLNALKTNTLKVGQVLKLN